MIKVGAAVTAVVLLIAAGLWIRSSMRASALADAVEQQNWDEALAIDGQHVPALIGRATQRLNAAPPDFEGALADIGLAEQVDSTAAELKPAKALAHAKKAAVQQAAAEKVAVAQPVTPPATAAKKPATPAETAAPSTSTRTIERVQIFRLRIRLGWELTVDVGFTPSVIEIVKVETGETRQRDWMSVRTNVKSHGINQTDATRTPLFEVECKGNKLTVSAGKGPATPDADQPLLVFAVVCHGVPGGLLAPKAFMFATGHPSKKTVHELKDGKGSSPLPALVCGVTDSELVVRAKFIGDPTFGMHKLKDQKKSDLDPTNFLIMWNANSYIGNKPEPVYLKFKVDFKNKVLISEISPSSVAAETTEERASLSRNENDRRAFVKLSNNLKDHIINNLTHNKGVKSTNWKWSVGRAAWEPVGDFQTKLLIRTGINGPGSVMGRYRPKNKNPLESAQLLHGLLKEDEARLENLIKVAKGKRSSANRVRPIARGGVVLGHLEWRTKSKNRRYEFKVKVLEFTKPPMKRASKAGSK
jgi:hypothetical protein